MAGKKHVSPASITRKFAILVGLIGFTIVGCGGGETVPELATVKGKLTMDGEPLADIKVTFSPDPERGCRGRTAQGVTNAQGEYTLTYQLPEEQKEGASIGWNKVTLRDQIPSRERDDSGQQIPSRISRAYSATPKTPLEFEVKAGENTGADFEVKPSE